MMKHLWLTVFFIISTTGAWVTCAQTNESRSSETRSSETRSSETRSSETRSNKTPAIEKKSVEALTAQANATTADVFEHPVKDNPARQEALRALTAKMQEQQKISGEFVQTKYLQVLTRPIVTQGKFALMAEKFLWDIEQPFAIRYEFSQQKLIRDLDGESQVVEPSSEPMLYGFFSFFASLFNLSEASLEKLFTLYYLPAADNSDHWVLGLRPKQEALSRSMKQLKISGSATHIHQVEVFEQNQDRTVLAFSYPASEVQTAP